MKESNGFKYSLHIFDEYIIRAKIRISTTQNNYEFDLYTTDTDKKSVEYFLIDNRKDNVTTINIECWTTKIDDDLDLKLIEYLFDL